MTKVASRLQLFIFNLQSCISAYKPASRISIQHEEVEIGEYNAAIIANFDTNTLLLLS